MCRERFEKRMKAELGNVSYILFIIHFGGGIFLKPMLMYNKEIANIQKMRKQRYLVSSMFVDI